MEAVESGACVSKRMPRLDFFAVLLGTRWRIFSDHRLPKGDGGSCDYKRKWVRVHPSLSPQKRFEMLHHECLHGAYEHLDEHWVEQFALDFSEVVYRPDVLQFLGLQRIPDSQQRAQS